MTYTQLPPEQWTYGYTPEHTVAEQEIYKMTKKADPMQFRQSTPASEDASSSTHFAFPTIDPSLSPSIPPAAGPVQKPKLKPTPPSIMFPFGSSLKAVTPFAATPQPQNRAHDLNPNLTPVSSDLIPFTSTTRSIPAPPKNHTSRTSSSSHPRSVSTIGLDDIQPESPTPETPYNLLRPQAAAIPKAITNKLMKQDARIRGLEEDITRMEREIDILKNRDMAEGVQHDINDLDNEQIGLEQRVDLLEETIAKQNKMIQQLLQMLEQRDGNSESDAEEVPVGKQKPARDNALNNATRKSLYVAMGLASTSQLKAAAALAPLKMGGSYVKDRESSGKLLRPDWVSSFAENVAWHDPMVKFLRAKGPTLVPALTSAILAQKSDQELLDRLEVVFKNVSTEFRKAGRVGGDGNIERDEEKQPRTEAEEKKENRHRGRKTKACQLLLKEHTETEAYAEVPAKTTRKPWITRPPAYRHSETEAAIVIIDATLMERRRQYERNNKGKTSAHPQICGETKDTPLPFIRGNNHLRIPRGAIDTDWLARHPEQDTPSRIHDEMEDTEHDADDEAGAT
ncbi:hypothetical protein DFH07DRAFT_784873 [Mycena maculata]|uniref:Uncharacterized protein n=1 Tax=Mycena maculata TaxID=230809 RepID=A0AAD7HEN1_9AGAR|nr:hypothetical protein DFH07DRAFT_784873 [Mycena maculata]